MQPQEARRPKDERGTSTQRNAGRCGTRSNVNPQDRVDSNPLFLLQETHLKAEIGSKFVCLAIEHLQTCFSFQIRCYFDCTDQDYNDLAFFDF